MKSVLRLLPLCVLLASCASKNTLFQKIPSGRSGITFNNRITENDSVNILDMENVYNGGGVGIGDFNGDGLPDIYFTGNVVPNKLYLNKGSLKFEDVTAAAKVEGEGKWSRGVSVVDINNDGLLDIYISVTILKDSVMRENILYINQGNDKNGVPVFKDMAAEYGLNDNSYTTQTAFFDYDNDGDLDAYMGVNVFAPGENANVFRRIYKNGEHPNTDRLYRNDWDSAKGHPVFTNVSKQAGISQEGFAHSVTICDLNQDGWKDVYVTNDYLSENLLYINNGNGTFTNRSKEYFKHTAMNAMGADVVDINNDGLSDVIELDMNPEDNYRKKTMLGSGNYQYYLNADYYGYQYQYVRNCLQLNRGNVSNSNDSMNHPVFSDISFYSGVAQTDWSWTPLVGDFDNDGCRDLIVTNGFPKDVTDLDFIAYRNTAFATTNKEELLSKMPEVKISNYAFRNGGNLKFSNVTEAWGLEKVSFSNGAAAVDLDGDGDLDVVINNINDEAFIYENTLDNQKQTAHNYLQVRLQGDRMNRNGLGSWVKIFYNNGQKQVYETNPVRGYLSSVQSDVNFGLGAVPLVDSLLVIWPDNKTQKITNIKTNQQVTVKQSEASALYSWNSETKSQEPSWFWEVGDSLGLTYTDRQKDFNDFSVQRLLPHKLSEYGPPMATGDVNNDGTEDLIIGNSDGIGEVVFLQKQNGLFEKKQLNAYPAGKTSVDKGLQLFDADNDGDLDLYISVGGYEASSNSACYQDKFYVNDGKGNFTLDTTVLPINHTSKSCVRAADFDNDGDLDLFIGGRVEPGRYPQPVSSILLRNDSKQGHIKFTDVTNEMAPALKNIGLVCDAQWVDINKDGFRDLVLAGEWMPVTFLLNQHGKFVDATQSSGIQKAVGWWNCLYAGDFDNDGDTDFIAGNLGENSFFKASDTYPLKNYFSDFDNNGTGKSITTEFIKDRDDTYKEFPANSRDEVIDQIPVIQKKISSYKNFASATIDKLFTKDQLNKALRCYANYLASSFIENVGNGKFNIKPLPALAQMAPVCAVVAGDFDRDGKTDVVLAGNDFGSELFNGKLDASYGLLLKGIGNGTFDAASLRQSGIYLPGQVNSVVLLKRATGGLLLVASQNRGTLKVYALKK